MSKIIINKCYDNYKRCSKNYYSDTWRATSNQNIDFFKTKKLDKLLTNSNLRGLAPIDNYPSCGFLNKSNSKILNRIQKKESFEIYKKIKHFDYYFSPSYIINYRHFLKVKNKINRDSNILLIGDGVGILSSIIAKQTKCRIFLCDLPETLIFQEYFLRRNLPKTKIQFIANSKDEINSKSRIILINADQLQKQKLKLNLVVNIDSFCEMDKSSVTNYFNYAKKNLVTNGAFYYCNTVGHSKLGFKNPSEYPLDNSFVVEDLDIFYPSHRDTFCKYLTVIAIKKNIYDKNNKNIEQKKLILKKFFFETENIIEKRSFENIKKNTISLLNKISNSNQKLSIFDKKLFFSLFKTKINKKGLLDREIFYHFLFLKIMKTLNTKKNRGIEDLIYIFKNSKINFVENTSIIKIASLLRFFEKKYYLRILKFIPENFFEVAFLKFFLHEKVDLKKQKKILKKLLSFKKDHFFDYLKLYYCSSKIGDPKISKFAFNKIKKSINHKDYGVYFLKLLFTLGKFKLFADFLKIYKKKFDLTSKEITSIFLSTNFSNPETRIRFKDFFSSKSKLFFNNNRSIDNLILFFKLGKITEKKFMDIIFKKYKDYYSIGYILKNTIHLLSKKNLKLLCNKSLVMRKNSQNINFISEIYFYNFSYKASFSVLNKIKDLNHFSLFAELKKRLSYLIIKNKENKGISEKVQNLTSSDFFKVIHNGRTVILPFLCNGNNAVQVNDN